MAVITRGASLPPRRGKSVQECSLQEDDWFRVLCWARAARSFCPRRQREHNLDGPACKADLHRGLLAGEKVMFL